MRRNTNIKTTGHKIKNLVIPLQQRWE